MLHRPTTWIDRASAAGWGALLLLVVCCACERIHAQPLIVWDFNEGEGDSLFDSATADGAQDAHYIGGAGVDAVDWFETGGPDGSGYYDFNQVASGEDLEQVFRTERFVDDPENPGEQINADILSGGAPIPSFDLTMSVWFRSAENAARDFATFARGNTSSWRLGVVGQSGSDDPDDRYLQLYARHAGQELTFEALDTVVNDGLWHHAALTTTRDESDPENPTETLRLYLDGELAPVSLLGFVEFTDGVTYPIDHDGLDIPVNGPFNAEIITVGGYGREGSVTQPQTNIREWVGDLDDFQLYGEALGADDIAFLHANPGQTIGGPVGVDGDYNGDGVVNAADYVVWRNSEGESGADLPADGDGSGTVDQADYEYWKSRFGDSATAGATTSLIPEPAALSLAVTACLVFFHRRASRFRHG